MMRSDHDSNDREDKSQFLARFLEIETNLYRYVCTVAPVPQDARDIIQETALALWEHHDRYDPARPYLPWALRVARNKARQHAEKVGRFPRLLEDDALLDLIHYEDEQSLPAFADRSQYLRECLSKLKGESLQLIEGYYWNRDPIGQLSQQLETSSEGTYKRLQRIREKLLQCILRKERQEASS